MSISQDANIRPRQVTISQDSGIVPANLPAAGGWEMGNSLYTDGVNDVAENSTATTTTFNPAQTAAWSASVWAKPTLTSQTQTLWGATGDPYDRFWMRLDGNGRMSVGSHGQICSTTISIPGSGSHWTSWNMYSVSVDVTSATTQTVYFYFNGALFFTLNKSKYSYTFTSTKLALGGTTRNGGSFQGYSTQFVFTENLVSADVWLALYNGGTGRDPEEVVTSPHSIYNINEPAGQTTGLIADTLSQQDLTMSGFVAPYGVNSESP